MQRWCKFSPVLQFLCAKLEFFGSHSYISSHQEWDNNLLLIMQPQNVMAEKIYYLQLAGGCSQSFVLIQASWDSVKGVPLASVPVIKGKALILPLVWMYSAVLQSRGVVGTCCKYCEWMIQIHLCKEQLKWYTAGNVTASVLHLLCVWPRDFYSWRFLFP